jgi:hypothetical protein
MDAMVRATVFGIDVWAETPLAALGEPPGPPTARNLDLLIDRDVAARPDWPARSRLLGEQRVDDRVEFEIRADQDAGWLVSGERYGGHVISADGLRLRCTPGGAAQYDWERLLVAQVLPLAAAVRGLEVLHASAVVWRGRAVALLGTGGGGKTTLALELCELGAEFLADDVLALEIDGEQLLAHPGPPVAAVGHGAAERLRAMCGWCGAAPLGDVIVLGRSPGGPSQPLFAPLTDPRVLLAGTFNRVLRDGAHAARLLEVCALAARGHVWLMRVGLHVDAATLAAAVIEQLEART